MVDDLNTNDTDENGMLPDDTPGSPPVGGDNNDDNPLTPPTDLPTDGQQEPTTPPVADTGIQSEEMDDEEVVPGTAESTEPDTSGASEAQNPEEDTPPPSSTPV